MLTARYTLRRIPVHHDIAPDRTTTLEAAPRRRALPRAERRASILRGAAMAFARSGYAQTSMEDVAAACGVTKLIVYRHFETKEQLYRAILRGVVERLGREIRTGLAGGTTRGVGARTLLSVAREDPAAFTLLWRHAAREPTFAGDAAELRSVSVDFTRRLAHLDRDDPVIDRWVAEVLFGWLVEATLAWLDLGDPARDDEFVAHTTDGVWAMRRAWGRGSP